MTLEYWLFFIGLWFLCGFLGWFRVIKLTGGAPSARDAFMIGPCMMGGPIMLAFSLRDFR